MNDEPEKEKPQQEPLKKAGDPLEETNSQEDEANPPSKIQEDPDTFEKVFEKGKQMGF
jgi:hypothetical protein